jgi:hypothetical protein
MLSYRTLAVLTSGALAASTTAAVVPFTETFSSSAANWSSAAAFTPLTYLPDGGPDGSGYASVNYSFVNNLPGDQPLVFRGQSNFGSSGNAFVGNWITDGVTQFSFSVRQHATAPVMFFARFAPAAGPGAVALFNLPATPGEWTTYSVAINPATPFIYEGTNFNGTFSNIARVQIGVLVDGGTAGQVVTLDIDNVSIIPAPGAALLPLAGLLAAGRRRR